nr:ATP-binding protein [Bacteroidota bacterium]
MEQLYEIFEIKLRGVPQKFRRFLYEEIDWSNRLISILGARGSGKTTLVMQHIKQQFKSPSNQVLYVDVSNLFFSNNTLLDLADMFYKNGGKFLFLDEIHKYPKWSAELKQIHDTYYDLKVVFTGSSIIEIKKGEADLSRRVVGYHLPGLSFREYLELDQSLKFEVYTLEIILENHREISHLISGQIRPLEYFSDYLKYGYYPYFIEGKNVYHEKLRSTINLILDVDIPAAENIDFKSIVKLKKLLSVISASVPFKPNTQKVSIMVEASRSTLIRFFTLLEKAQLISLLQSETKEIQALSKPEKIYMNNTNLMFALAPQNVDKGNLRETFFYNQTNYLHDLALPKTGDFIVDGKWIFEVGGKNKTRKQIAGTGNAWVVSDEIESGFGNKIPLWMLGFQY